MPVTMDEDEVYQLEELEKSSSEYRNIANRVRVVKPTIGKVTVVSIEKVYNFYTSALFNLKKFEINAALWEEVFWHGTRESNADLICKNNLDYRKTLKQFGKGVSFSKYFSNAFHYSVSKCPVLGRKYYVFRCRVVKRNSHVGHEFTKYPKNGCDSTVKKNGDVIVKYDDDTFYPMYKICFTIKSFNDISDD